ncbi:Hypothetical protein NCS54_00089300 [Fusarium falciforme]|uniref:Uncharacterized protein n=1 Tax=Fusarium falciforme TaxID=195108 RepID=A0A9W8V7P7_9HYPO|nr:Hypothetical protein NCS54_00089300 [Fusarium falciforme]KAJ4196816.1 hypothetical protein NW755_001588 [Fusarium falciforme]WAO83694.1 Hypothetical protein NCS54_00089300 [Fusarium falciforme]
MAATYKQFLAAPSSSLLADTAALYYVTTTTTFSGPTQIIKHLNGLQKVVAKKKEEVFNVVDGGNVAVFEIDTGLGFQTGGGPYLPGLDDNFLSARDVYLPITHFVSFDEAGKISQIRLQWDQGSLLKQVEVIGKSGRNWPIRDSREQITYIRSAIKSAGTAPPAPLSHNESIVRTRGNSSNAFRDPHASLQLFGSREEIETEPAAVVSPYAGTRPRQRSFTEILGYEPDSPSSGRQQISPAKAGQGKNFQPMRLFDGYEHTDVPDQPLQQNKRYIRPNPNKYSHFDFADGSDPQDAPQKGVSIDEKPKSKHDSQWSFEDFVTPQKVKPSRGMRTQDVRHWGADENTADEAAAQPAKPRRDAEAHFELLDDGERVPQPQRPGAKPRGYAHNEGLGLYKNQLFDTEETGSNERPLGNITNVNRGKDFGHHFDIADQSPAHQKENKPVQEPTNDSRIHIAGDGMGGRKGTNRDWLYGETEEVAQSIPARQANVAAAGVPLGKSNKIATAGDGMGGRKGTERDWLYNETQEESSKSVPGRKQGASGVPSETQDSKIAIAGDGMGGRKGTNRDWLYGDLSEQPLPTRKQPTTSAKKDFWDF